MRVFCTAAVLLASCYANFCMAEKIPLWVASGKQGIYGAVFDSDKGTISDIRQLVTAASAGFLALHPSKPILYSIHRKKGGSILKSYIIVDSGDLKLLNEHDASLKGAAHLSVNQNGDMLAVAYYGGGAMGVYALDDKGKIASTVIEQKHEGSSVVQKRQQKPHPHWAGFSADNRFIFVTDLGTDHIWIYRLNNSDKTVTLHNKIATRPGAGPRHMAFHSSGEFVYVTDELLGEVSAYRYHQDQGRLSVIEHIESAPEAKSELWSNVSEVQLHPSSKFLYVANRGYDAISVFKVNPLDGKLTAVEREPIRGSISRHFTFDSTGKWMIVAGQHSNTLAVFHVSQTDGSLQYSRNIAAIPRPSCVLLAPK